MSLFYLLTTLTTSLIYKTSLYCSHFSIFKGHKKNIDLKSKTKYIDWEQQKLLIAKLKNRYVQPTNFIQNKHPGPLKKI